MKIVHQLRYNDSKEQQPDPYMLHCYTSQYVSIVQNAQQNEDLAMFKMFSPVAEEDLEVTEI